MTDVLSADRAAGGPIAAPRVAADRQGWVRLLLFLPAGAIMLLGFFWPVATIVLRSLSQDGSASFDSLSLDHYRAIVQDEVLRLITQQTVFLALASTALTVILAFPVAYLISRLGRRLAVVLLCLVLIPFWVSVLVRLFAFTAILGRDGVVNQFLGLFGVGPLALLFNGRATVIGMVAYLLPYLVLILYSAMSSVDQSLVTAARTMGASSRQAFVQVYLPQVRSALVSGTMLIFVLGLGFFLTPAILGGPRDITLPVFIQQQIDLFAWGRASAAGVLLLLVSLIGYAAALRISGVGVLNTGGRPVNRGGVGRDPLRFAPATAGAWLLTGIAILMLVGPLLIVVPSAFTSSNEIRFPPAGFSLRWFGQLLTDPLWTGAIIKSARVGVLVAVVTTLAALAAARAFTQLRSGALRTGVQTVALAPLIVPVILLAIGDFDVQARLGWIGTDHGLVVAHVVLAFPFAFLLLSNALARLETSLEEAAWSMGVGRTRAFWTVAVPNVAPAVTGAVIISFMTSWDEAVVALFQSGITKTLPVTIYSFLTSGVTPVVSAVAVALMVPVVLAMVAYAALGGRSERRRRLRRSHGGDQSPLRGQPPSPDAGDLV